MSIPATPPTVITVPMGPVAQPRCWRKTPRKGPIPACMSAIKKLSAWSAVFARVTSPEASSPGRDRAVTPVTIALPRLFFARSAAPKVDFTPPNSCGIGMFRCPERGYASGGKPDAYPAGSAPGRRGRRQDGTATGQRRRGGCLHVATPMVPAGRRRSIGTASTGRRRRGRHHPCRAVGAAGSPGGGGGTSPRTAASRGGSGVWALAGTARPANANVAIARLESMIRISFVL